MKKKITHKIAINKILKREITCLLFLIFVAGINIVNAQFVHPGISHKKSDLDRMKYMVEAEIDPWFTSYQNMVADSKSSYNYVVQGDVSFTELGRDSGVNYGAWNSDIRAAYYNAIRWYVTGDTRHADKAVEIFSAWSNLTSVTSGGTEALSGGVGYIMIEAAEIIKSTYSGWLTEDIDAFKAMLVYPGYSNTTVPPNIRTNTTFYWSSYQGDPVRHGNQGLSGWRTVMAMGIFLDNEIMFDRALRYIKGLPHRLDDLPYPPGPNTSTSLVSIGDHADTYNISQGNSIPDYGYNEVMTNYIYTNGQCQESSRDQAHVLFGLGLLGSMSEMSWNQGDDLYGHADSRLLLGLEFSLKYNVSYIASYPDQTTPWVPTDFIQGFERTGRWYSKSMSPEGIGDFTGNRPNWEMATAHYIGRGFKTEEEAKWTKRARDKSIEIDGYERAGWTNDAIGWGGLTFRRPNHCYGDPITGFDSNGLPEYNMHEISSIIEAEDFDYFLLEGEGRTYVDMTSSNTGGEYRTDENVDIKVCSEGGYNVEDIDSGEWLTYTVNIPSNGTYDLSIRYASANSSGAIKFNFGGTDVTSDVSVPFGSPNSTSLTDWQDFTVASEVRLSKGVQAMKVLFSGSDNAFELNNLTVTLVTADPDPINLAVAHGTATQSTDRPSDGFAPNAIDGDTNGVWSSGSVTHTGANATLDPEPWWQVDLGANYNIETIDIFNRTDCCSDRLNNFTVEVLDSNGSVTFTQFYASHPNPSISVATGGVTGSVVRISKTSSTALSIAEVEVYGVDAILSNKKFELINNISIYPNPTNSIITITNSGDAVVEIYDIVGKLMLKESIKSNKESIDISRFPSGIYFTRINTIKGSVSKKVIKK